MERPPPLNAMRVFAVAARRLSLKQAAAELFVTPGAVSRQIQTLEAHLGVPLFERRFREIALTQMGALYFEQIGPALHNIDQASRRVRELTQASRRTTVRVNATPTFTMHWLIPHLAEFHARHPEIEVRIGTSQGVIERRPETGIDLHVRRDPAQFNGLEGEPFKTEYSALVCSPRLAGWRSLNSPAVLAQATFVHIRARPDLWPKWFAAHGLDDRPAARRLELDNTILAIQAVIEGLGVGFIPVLFIDGLLDSGALVLLPHTAPMATGAYHVLMEGHAPSPAARIFADWLKERARADAPSGRAAVPIALEPHTAQADAPPAPPIRKR